MSNCYTMICFEVQASGALVELINRYEAAIDAGEGEDHNLFSKLMGSDFESLSIDVKLLEEIEPQKVMISSESPNLEALALLLQHFLKEQKTTNSIGFEWADTCDKDRPGAFGGGAVFITAENIEWLNTRQWLAERVTGIDGVELKILTKLIDDALAMGLTITVRDEEDLLLTKSTSKESIIKECGHSGFNLLLFHEDGGFFGSTILIWGNGDALISDYVDNEGMERLMKGANDLANSL